MNKKTSKISLCNSGDVVCNQVLHAHTFISRLVGLLGKKYLPEDQGLWIKPCNGIHTIAMKFPIDVLFLDAEYVVKKISYSVNANRFVFGAKGVKSVIELRGNSLKDLNINIGDQLIIESMASEDQEKIKLATT